MSGAKVSGADGKAEGSTKQGEKAEPGNTIQFGAGKLLGLWSWGFFVCVCFSVGACPQFPNKCIETNIILTYECPAITWLVSIQLF